MALMPPEFLNTVVAVGVKPPNNTTVYTGTGFLYAYPFSEVTGTQSGLFKTFFVTNAHVYDEIVKSIEDLKITDDKPIKLRFNQSADNSSIEFDVPSKSEDGNELWIKNPNGEDVAVLAVSESALRDNNIPISCFFQDKNTLTREQAEEKGLFEGDGVFVLGFPMGLAGVDRNYVIVRSGIVARVQDWYNSASRDYLIDASVYPGNSGGPVIIKPEITKVGETKNIHQAYLIGMVKEYVPYREFLYSRQTNTLRMELQENSGLGVVVSVDAIQDTIKNAFQLSKALNTVDPV